MTILEENDCNRNVYQQIRNEELARYNAIRFQINQIDCLGEISGRDYSGLILRLRFKVAGMSVALPGASLVYLGEGLEWIDQ